MATDSAQAGNILHSRTFSDWTDIFLTVDIIFLILRDFVSFSGEFGYNQQPILATFFLFHFFAQLYWLEWHPYQISSIKIGMFLEEKKCFKSAVKSKSKSPLFELSNDVVHFLFGYLTQNET